LLVNQKSVVVVVVAAAAAAAAAACQPAEKFLMVSLLYV